MTHEWAAYSQHGTRDWDLTARDCGMRASDVAQAPHRCMQLQRSDGHEQFIQVRMEPGVLEQPDGAVPVLLLCVDNVTELMEGTPRRVLAGSSAASCAKRLLHTIQAHEQAIDRGLVALRALSAPAYTPALTGEGSGVWGVDLCVGDWSSQSLRDGDHKDKSDASRGQAGRVLDRKRLNRLMRRLSISSHQPGR